MYVDASALVAILLNEPERDQIILRLENADAAVTSLVSVFEAMAAVGRELGDRAVAGAEVENFLASAGIRIVDIGAGTMPYLQHAYRLYGKGSGHPAQLNMGDCFSYAMAKTLGQPLLYKGNDFVQTDLA